MIIQTNSPSEGAYVPYLSNINNLTKSAQRLATGSKFANVTDGTGDLGVADRMRANILGTNSLVTSMEDVAGYSSTQDEILGHVSDIVARMSELAAGAVDQTKTTADRNALNAELRALDTEIQGLATTSQYNGTNLFGTTQTIRIGVETSDTITFSQVDLATLTFVAMSLNSFTTASAALISLKSRAASVNALRVTSRSQGARIERTLDFTRAYVSNLSNSESKIRDVDVAMETGTFTQKQVLVSSAQAVLAQLNNLSQGALRFFG